MSYRIEGKDIIIAGFENGIADSPYSGISDMRGIENVSIPGEASVAFATQAASQANISNATFTANASTDTLTWAGTAGFFTDQVAITVSNSGGALPAGLSANTTYYVRNSTTTTFQVSTTIAGVIVDITGAGSGTNSFTTINTGRPNWGTSYLTGDPTVTSNVANFYVDDNDRIWWFNGTFWVFLNNALASSFKGTGISAVAGYLFHYRDLNLDYLPIATLTTSAWAPGWKTIAAANTHQSIIGQDGNLYFCNGSTINSLIFKNSSAFDPTSSGTFTYNVAALQLPQWETSQCIGTLGTNILVGGSVNVVYQWDRLSVGYTPIYTAENGTYRIVGVNTTAYLFCGRRGRIYQTNGAQVSEFKKIPDHLSGIVNPYYIWGDAQFNREQLYFGITATDNAGTAINQYGGLWALDLKSGNLRMLNKLSYGSFAGLATVIIPNLIAANINNSPPSALNNGYGLFIGWTASLANDSSVGVDSYNGALYTGGQSYVDSDLIPVGTLLDPFTGSQIEWKTSVPIGANGTAETVALYYRTKFSDAYTLIGTTTSSTGQLSDMYPANFQQAQWVQIRAVLTSSATTPTYNRLTQIRLRDYPSGNQSITPSNISYTV